MRVYQFRHAGIVGIPEKGLEFLPTPDPACKHNSIPRPLGQVLGQGGNRRLDLWQTLSHHPRPDLRNYNSTQTEP